MLAALGRLFALFSVCMRLNRRHSHSKSLSKATLVAAFAFTSVVLMAPDAEAQSMLTASAARVKPTYAQRRAQEDAARAKALAEQRARQQASSAPTLKPPAIKPATAAVKPPVSASQIQFAEFAAERARQQKALEAAGLCEACLFSPNRNGAMIGVPQKIPLSIPAPLMSTPSTAPMSRGWFQRATGTAFADVWGVRHIRQGFSTFKNYILSYTPESLSNLRKVTKREIMVPRAQKGRRLIGGNVSKGMCKEAVNDILTEAGILDERIPGNSARMAHPYLSNLRYPNGKPKFANIMSDLAGDLTKAPEGAILVYDDVTPGKKRDNRHGHIEIKSWDEERKVVVYCSDHCKDIPISSYIPTRKPIAVYIPLKEQ